MKINKVENDFNAVGFRRKLNAAEMKVYTNSINQGLKLLNKQIDIIIHNSSAPTIKTENIGIGSLFSNTTQKLLIPFLKSHGITGIQQEPNNLRKLGDYSPYAPESSAKNIFMIPLEKLITSEYGNILSKQTFENIIHNVPNTNKVDYAYIEKTFEKALKEAYKNFIKDGVLRDEFNEFKTKNHNLEKAAIFNVLSHKYVKNWEVWKNVDKFLFSPQNEKQQAKVEKRLDEIRTQYADDIDYFMFKQFIVELENKKSNKLSDASGIKIIGDSPVASPAADEWINQNLYLKGMAIGCPPDYFSKNGQRWGFKYFNPKYIFNPDGTLGKAGKILKEKYDKFFSSFPGGLRIDHVIGLVDPFIYTVKSKKMTSFNSGRIYSLFTGMFQKKEENYSNIMEKIVLKSAKEHGMSKDNIICEDLGDYNEPTNNVMNKLGLSGLTVTQFDYRGATAPQKNVIMIGSHDNKSFLEYTDEIFDNPKRKKQFIRKTGLLAKDIAPKDASKQEIKKLRTNIRKDKKSYIAASFAELFTSPAKRIQIFFADFWGIPETYNVPGTTKGNWSLRIGSDFENDYYKAVSEGKAPNLAKSIAVALRQRGLDKKNAELMKNLDDSAKILAEV